jgi:hypothetical protein
MMMEQTNWIIWSVCGCVWIWNGWHWHQHQKIIRQLQLDNEERKLDLDRIMRDLIAQNRVADEVINHHSKRPQ